MNSRTSLLIIGFFLMVANIGCSAKNLRESADFSTGADEKLLWSSESQRPGWTMEEPATDGGVMHFVGLSGNFATERQGREDAKRNAFNAVIKYAGVLVKEKFERARVSFGLESNVVNPTTSAREYEKQLAENIARKVKSRKWYIEKWQMPTGIAYRVFVLADVPQASLDESLKDTAGNMRKKAERAAKELDDENAKSQAEKTAEFWKQMQEQGVLE